MASGVSAGGGGGAVAPRLDLATLTVTAYSAAGEVVITEGKRTVGPTRTGKRGAAEDPDRARASAVARAGRNLRRACVSNRATRLASLTFAPEHLPDTEDEGWALIEPLRRELLAMGVWAAVIPQWGDKSGRYHFHLALSRYIPKTTLAALWPWGWVDIRQLRPPRRNRVRTSVRQGQRELARTVARYVASYVREGARAEGASGSGDSAGAPGPKRTVGFNRKRYSVPKGTTASMPVVRFTCVFGLHEAWAEAQRICGHHLHEVWRSPDPDDSEWRGPPTLLLMG